MFVKKVLPWFHCVFPLDIEVVGMVGTDGCGFDHKRDGTARASTVGLSASMVDGSLSHIVGILVLGLVPKGVRSA